MTNSTDTYYYFADGLGSIRNVVESDEDIANTYDYRAFGILITETENVDSPFEFTGRAREPGGLSHMHYYRNRYYMPGVGIFTSRDAMWADIHRGWGYVGNAPTMVSDPSGLGVLTDILNGLHIPCGTLKISAPRVNSVTITKKVAHRRFACVGVSEKRLLKSFTGAIPKGFAKTVNIPCPGDGECCDMKPFSRSLTLTLPIHICIEGGILSDAKLVRCSAPAWNNSCEIWANVTGSVTLSGQIGHCKW